MAVNEKKDLNQKAVYWAFSSYDENGEVQVTSTAVEIDVRWEEGVFEVNRPDGSSFRYDVKLRTKQALAKESIVWLGILRDVPSDLSTISNLYVIRDSKVTPDLKGRNYSRKYFLNKYSDTMVTTE